VWRSNCCSKAISALAAYCVCLSCVAVCCSVLQCVALCVAVYCSVLQCVYHVVVLSCVRFVMQSLCDMTHSYVRHSYMCIRLWCARCVTWFIHMWDIPVCVWRSTHLLFQGYFRAHCVTWLIRACHMTHLYASLDSSKCVIWQTFICVFGVALVARRLFVMQCVAVCCSVLQCVSQVLAARHDWLICQTFIYVFGVALVAPRLFPCSLCDLTHSDVWCDSFVYVTLVDARHDSFIRVSCLIHTCEVYITHCNSLFFATHGNWLFFATHCTWRQIHTCDVNICSLVQCVVLQCVVVYCSVLQCVAVCCSVLQCVLL